MSQIFLLEDNPPWISHNPFSLYFNDVLLPYIIILVSGIKHLLTLQIITTTSPIICHNTKLIQYFSYHIPHAVHYIPMTNLFYNPKFTPGSPPFPHLAPPQTSTSGNDQSILGIRVWVSFGLFRFLDSM